MARIQALHHAAITVPTTGLEEARRFYSGLLGLEERDRPAAELGRPGIWYRIGEAELHIQCRDIVPSGDSDHHPALVVDDVAGLREHLRANGVEVLDAQPLSDRERFFCRDPFGNRLEFLSQPR
jgi:catechol 2,3-dioxygenase-like lactoylglutathione lyase family enzyme